MDHYFWRIASFSSEYGFEYSYTPWLVLVSILNSVIAGYFFSFFGALLRSEANMFKKKLYKILGSLGTGVGIWCLHFTAMLAWDHGIDLIYSIPITLFSLLPIVLFAYLAYSTYSTHTNNSFFKPFVFLANGTLLMHFIALEGVVAQRVFYYDAKMFVSALVFCQFSFLTSGFIYSKITKALRWKDVENIFSPAKVVFSILLSFSVSGSHYIAMSGVRFGEGNSAYTDAINQSSRFSDPFSLVMTLSVMLFVMLLFLLISIYIDRTLKKNTEIMEIMLGVAPAGLMAFRQDGKILSINSFASKTLGWKGGQHVSIYPSFFGKLSLLDISRALLKRDMVEQSKAVIKTLAGKEMDVHIVAKKAHIRSEDYIVVMFHDVTNLRRAETSLHENAKLASLGLMASGVAHEINTPLGAIMLRISQLKRFLGLKDFEQKIPGVLDSMDQACAHIDGIIKGLKNISRSGVHDEKQRIQVAELVGGVTSLCQSKFDEAKVSLVVHPPNEDLLLDCNVSKISQVLVILLENALLSYESGNSKKRKVTLSSSGDGTFVEFRVKDGGPGIPPWIESKMFEPFYTSREVGKGTGLGLSIAKGIADDHSGNLVLENRGSPTVFLLSLPGVLETSKGVDHKIAG